MRLDLHLHTNRSDGLWTPAELAAEAGRRRLHHWAVTDHDSLAAPRELAGTTGLIPGVELSCRHAGREVHIVGLGVALDHPALNAALAGIATFRRDRAEKLLAACLARRGVAADVAVLDVPDDAICTRSHVARALHRAGLVTHPGQAFQQDLGDAHLTEMDQAGFPTVAAGCELLRDAGGVAILAHPAIYQDVGVVEELLRQGCDGLEAVHHGCLPPLSRLFRNLARKKKLLLSCGSDFHGHPPCRIGDWRLSAEEFAPLAARLGVSGLAPAPAG